MKNNRITRAYDSINPTSSDKERMLGNILARAQLEDTPGTQRRKVRPDTRHSRKRRQFRVGWILPVAACLALLLLGGFLLRYRSSQPDHPSLVNPMYEMTAKDHYAPVLDKYRRAMEESWTREQCVLEGISPNMEHVTQKTGYVLLDLDADGREELIIAQEASPDHDIVWDLYTTLEDGTPIQLLSDEGAWFNCGIFQNGVIGIDRSRKQPGEHEYYTLQSGQLVLLDSLFPEGDQMMRMDQDGNKVPVSDQEAMEIVYSYKFRKLDLIWLEELRDAAASDRYQEVLDTYRRAIAESWSRERCQTEGISPRMQSGADLTHAGYALLDLDNDGREELIIAEGSTHIANVWDLYTTQEDGTPVRLFMDACDGNQCNVYAGNYIRIEHSGKTAGETNFYTLESGQLVMRERVTYEGDNILHTDTKGNTHAITNREYMDISNSYQNLELDLTWLAELPDYLRDADTVERYTIILEQYRTALMENWGWEQYEQNDMNQKIAWDTTDRNHLGWCVMDIDQNGVGELIISDGNNLFDLYTLQNGSAVRVLTQFDDRYSLREDGTIEMMTTFSKGCSWSFYRLSGQKLKLQSILVYRNEYEGTTATEQYYYGPDGDNCQPISKEEAGALIVSKRMELDLTPFAEKHASDPAEHYQAVLERYRTALMEKWDPGMCMDQDISMMVSRYAETPDMLCAFYLDLDEDGTAELMITDGMMIFDLYTIKNGQPVHLLTGWERNSYRFCMENVIYNHASNSAFNSCYNYYRVENGSLVLVESIVFDASIDPENPWFLSADGETPTESITEQKAKEIMDRYPDMSILGMPIL